MSTRRPWLPARPVGVLGAAAILGLLLASGAAVPVWAAPTVLLVSGATGTDAGTCTSAPCATLAYALTEAASGDTIEIEGSVKASDSNTTGGAVVPASIRSLNIVGVSGPTPPQLMGGLVGLTLGSTLSVQSGQTVVISNLEILDGVAQFGGGINNQGNLTLDRVAVDSNVATPSTLLCATSTTSCQGFGQGGGIYNDGSLTLSRSSVTENDVEDVLVTAAGPGGLQLLLQGGGIYNVGSLLVYESSLAHNSASVNSSYPVPQRAAGGAIFNLASTAEVIASTIFKNNAPVGSGIYQGGAIGVPHLGLGASLVVGNSGSGGPASECGWDTGAAPPTSLGYNAADSGARSGCGLTQPTDGVASSSGIDDSLASGAYGLLTGQPEDYVIPFGTTLGGLLVCPALDQIQQPRPLPGEASCSPGAVEPNSGFAQPTSPSPPTITSVAATTFIVGVAQSFQVTAGGSPAPAIFETGALPAGVTVSPHGLISGTAAMGAAGTYPITLSAQNTVAPSATQQFTLVVGRDPTGLTVGASPNPADAGHQLTFTATVTGAVQGVEPTGQVTISAPQQVVCTITLSSGSGTCSGTLAPATGTVVASAKYSGDQSYQPATSSTTVQYVGRPAVASASTLPPATYGTPYQLTLLATGGSPPYQWGLGAGAPPGLALSGAQLTGTPTTPGTFNFQITATDTQGELSTQDETLTVNPQTPHASLLVSPSGSVAGRPVTLSAAVVVTGGLNEPTGSVIFSGGGASLCSATVIGGTASCTTTRLPVGSGTATATYSGSADYAAATAQAAYLVVPPLRITTTTLPAGVLGQAYNFRLTAAGGTAPLSWKVAGGSLPPGLSLSLSGLISGVPSQAAEQPVTVAVSDASPEVPQQVTTQFQVTVLSATSTPGSSPAGTGGASGASTGAGGAGGSQTPSPAASGGGSGSGGAVASSGRVSAGAAAPALSWWDAVGVVVLALLAALGVLVGRRRRAR